MQINCWHGWQCLMKNCCFQYYNKINIRCKESITIFNVSNFFPIYVFHRKCLLKIFSESKFETSFVFNSTIKLRETSSQEKNYFGGKRQY